MDARARPSPLGLSIVTPISSLADPGSRNMLLRMTRTAAEVKALGIPTGILATVRMTREESVEQLTESAAQRLNRMLRAGTTTVESKSGYGLNLQQEMKMLEVNRNLQSSQPVDVISTFLGAHDFPPELSRERYLEMIIHEMIPKVAETGMAEACDVYCDDGYYTVEESQKILEAGRAAGLTPKIHTDAYSQIGGSDLAADMRMLSADHLNYTTRAQMKKLAQAGVIGVIMPGLDFAVQHPRPFDARAMLDRRHDPSLGHGPLPGLLGRIHAVRDDVSLPPLPPVTRRGPHCLDLKRGQSPRFRTRPGVIGTRQACRHSDLECIDFRRCDLPIGKQRGREGRKERNHSGWAGTSRIRTVISPGETETLPNYSHGRG